MKPDDIRAAAHRRMKRFGETYFEALQHILLALDALQEDDDQEIVR